MLAIIVNPPPVEPVPSASSANVTTSPSTKPVPAVTTLIVVISPDSTTTVNSAVLPLVDVVV